MLDCLDLCYNVAVNLIMSVKKILKWEGAGVAPGTSIQGRIFQDHLLCARYARPYLNLMCNLKGELVMISRLHGLLLLIRGLSPFLVILVIGIAGIVMYNDLREALAGPIESIQSEIDDVKETVDTAREQVDAVVDDVSSLVNTLSSFSLPNLIPNIPSSISLPTLVLPSIAIPVPTVSVDFCSVNLQFTSVSYPCDLDLGTSNFSINLPDIPSFNIPIPGLSELGDLLSDAFSPITDIFDLGFSPVFEGINALGQTLRLVPDSFNTIVDLGRSLLSDVGDVIAQWGQTLLIVFLVLAVLALIYFGVPFVDNITRGWRLLRGRPAD